MCGRKPKKLQQKSKKLSDDKQTDIPTSSSNVINNNTNSSISKESSKRLTNGSAKCDNSSKKEKKCKDTKPDLIVCRQLLDEMERHDDSWPFLLPVNTKQFPTYKKIIKKPMDTSTIRHKLDSCRY